NLHGTDGTLSHDVPLTFQSLAFTLDVSPLTQVLIPGQSTTIDVTNAADGAFSDTISLQCQGALPTGMSCSNFNPNPMTANGSSVLTINTTASTPLQDTIINISGAATSNNSLSTTTGDAHIVTQNFSVGSATPNTLQTITDGNGQNFTVNFAAQNGFNQPITVGCANLAAGMSCSASPAVVTPGTSSIVSVATTVGTTPLQTTTLQVTGASLGVTRTSANVQVKTVDFQITSTTP